MSQPEAATTAQVRRLVCVRMPVGYPDRMSTTRMIAVLAAGVLVASCGAVPSPSATLQPLATPSPSSTGSSEATPSQLVVSQVGVDWARLPDDPALAGGEINAVVAGGPGLVAVGCATATLECDLGPATWTSIDGRHWTKGPPVPAADAVTMRAVIAAGTGFIAVGWGGIWHSPDGLHWTRVATPATPGFGTDLHGATAWRGGYVAVGNEFNSVTNHAVAWTSIDGQHWSKAPPSPGFEGLTGLGHVVAGGPGLIANDEDFSGSSLWTSTDGRRWQKGPRLPAGVELLQLLATKTGYVAVGVGVKASASAGNVMLAGFRPASPTGRSRTFDIGNAIAVAYGSTDGLHWTAQAVEAGDDGWMTGVVVVRDFLVAVGFVQAGGVAVWRSDDFQSWSRMADPFALHPDPSSADARMQGVVAEHDSVVAWGSGATGPAIWVSPPPMP